MGWLTLETYRKISASREHPDGGIPKITTTIGSPNPPDTAVP